MCTLAKVALFRRELLLCFGFVCFLCFFHLGRDEAVNGCGNYRFDGFADCNRLVRLLIEDKIVLVNQFSRVFTEASVKLLIVIL